METRICPICGRELPVDSFYASSKTGRPTGRCKECIRRINQKARRDNFEIVIKGRVRDKARRDRIKAETAKAVPPHISLEEAAQIYQEIVGKKVTAKHIGAMAMVFRQWAVFGTGKSGKLKLVGIREGHFRSFVQGRRALNVEVFHTRDNDFGNDFGFVR